MEKVTAGREAMGRFAPKFAELNDDVLFGQVWSREEKLSTRNRCLITVAALMAGGILDSSLQFHIQNAKNNGITREEMTEALTRLAQGLGSTADGQRGIRRRISSSRGQAERPAPG